MAPRLRQVKPPADAAPANSEASPSFSKATSLSEPHVREEDTVGAGTGKLGEVSSRKDRLGLLHVALKDLVNEIDDEANVPERWETTGAGELADTDSQVIRLAANVVHRLLLWELFPLASAESYFKAGE